MTSHPAKFQVDTHLFRELGQLLVGRDSTALVELVKNAYDADATTVTLYGEALSDPGRGKIIIQDDGIGMDVGTFERGFLTIASRMKEAGERRSPVYRRRYTGAKGIGRLAAHKLACKLVVESVPQRDAYPRPQLHGVKATIDWTRIEREFKTLDEIDGKAVSVEPTLPIGKPGTKISLRHLREPWGERQLAEFLQEVKGLTVPRELTEPLPSELLSQPGLFERPRTRDSNMKSDPGFRIILQGDFATGEDYWPAILQSSHWLIDIDASREGVSYAIIPTKTKIKQAPHARAQTVREAHPNPEHGPFFQGRILIREGGQGDQKFRAFAKHVSGVRVYQEGFRVLPYGELSDDWLYINRDAIDRTRVLKFVDDSDLPGLSSLEEGLSTLPTKHYFGAIFLVVNEAPELIMLINREGFVPNPTLNHLRQIVRKGIDLATRLRASVGMRVGSSDLSGSNPPRVNEKPARAEPPKLAEAIKALRAQAGEVSKIAHGLDGPAAATVRGLVESIRNVVEPSEQLMNEVSLIRVLASVGTQMAAFTHEVNRLLAAAQSIESVTRRLRDDPDIGAKARPKVSKLIASVEDLRRAIEHQSSFFGEILNPDARRRRSRLSLAATFDISAQLVERRAEEKGISVQNDIPPELKSSLMFPAQLIAVMSNLLTNATKAAGRNGRVYAVGQRGPRGSSLLRIENTGAAVNLEEAERWFRPFESTTAEVDPILGQGMGLGLGITRDILSELGATINFVLPSKGYSTAVQIDFPE